MKFMRLLPVLLLLVILAGCGLLGGYDINGEWSFRSGDKELFDLDFLGTASKGAVIDPDYPDDGGGTYAVADQEVEFDYASTLVGGMSCHFNGAFTDEDTLEGTMAIVAPYPPFAWSAEVVGKRL